MSSTNTHRWVRVLRRLLLALCVSAALVAQEATNASAPGANATAPTRLEPFEVTGSLIKRTDFEGPSPVRVITREEIDLASAIGLTDVLRELPEATAIGINEGSTTGFARGT